MATKKTAAKKATGTSLAKWDEELAKYAEQAAATEANAGSGLKSFSLKAGILSIDDQPMPNNEMVCVVLDHILENVYYEHEYDPDNPMPPSAYALGRDEKEMRWSEDSIAPYAGELCIESDINKWGSSDKGRGKKARNLRRLLIIPAGTIDKRTGAVDLIEDEEHYKTAKPAFMKLPPTSTTNWSLYVKQLTGTLNRPPFVIATRVKVVPDAKSQFKVTFEALAEMPEHLIETLIERHKEAEQLIFQPYDMSEREAPAKSARGAKGKTAAAAKKTSKRKY